MQHLTTVVLCTWTRAVFALAGKSVFQENAMTRMIVLLLLLGQMAVGPAAGTVDAQEPGDPAVPDLIYDPATGEVVLDLDGAVGM